MTFYTNIWVQSKKLIYMNLVKCRCSVRSSLTLWVLAWGAAPDSEGLLWPPILLIEAPALGDLVGTCLSPVLGSWRLGFPFGNRCLGRTGEHLVLQAGFPTAESKQREGGNRTVLMAFPALWCVKKNYFFLLLWCLKLNLSNSALMWKQILPQLKRKMGNVLQRKEPCPHTNIVEHSVGQASSRKLQASMHGKQSDSARLKRKSRDLTLCKKWTQIVQNKSPSYSMLCLTHESRSKETHC